MKRIIILYIVYLITNITINSQPAHTDIFNYLNLDYPGLEKVKTAFEAGEVNKAEVELLEYYQNRIHVKNNLSDLNLPINIEEADNNVNNTFDMKTIKVDFGEEIKWTDVQIDKEWQFSLGRMKWFLNYAGVYQATSDEKYVNAWMNQIKSWIKLGDPGYPRTIDTGRRMENLVYSYLLFIEKLKSEAVTPEFNALLLASLHEQAEFIYNPDNWRRYSNWGTFENSGFTKLAILFPEFKNQNRWLKELFFRMRVQLGNSFHSDGMHIEVSPSYHSHELQVWFEFIQLAELNNIEEPWSPQTSLPSHKELIIPKALALLNFYKPTGFVPQVGDTDNRDEREILYKIGKYYDVPELIYVATNGKEGKAPQNLSMSFLEGGYSIMRSGWGEGKIPFKNELYMLFDSGTNKPWHAHYDMLNLVATAYGYDILKDPGRYTYTDGIQRDNFKSTAYHNTIVVDSMDQKSNSVAPHVDWLSLNGFDYVIGEHNGYDGVTHSRSVLFIKPEYWIVVDRLNSSENHTYEQYWHLSDKSVNKVKFDDELKFISAPHMILFTPHSTSVSKDGGYLSYQYLQKKEAPVIRTKVNNVSNTILPTVIYPFDALIPQVSVEENSVINNEQIVMTIKGTKFNDIFYERSETKANFKNPELETDAKLIYIRFDPDKNISRLLSIDGSYLIYKEKSILNLNGTKANVSFKNTRVEIEGNCIKDFGLKVNGVTEIYLNHNKISFEKGQEGMIYNFNKSD